MKFIPEGVVRLISEQSLSASENAPKLLFVGGVVGMVASTALACRATLQVEQILDEVQHDLDVIADMSEKVDAGDVAPSTTYGPKERKQDKVVALTRGAGRIGKAYAPSILLGAASIACLTKSHNILQQRNLALTAAYAAVDSAFNRYRARVVDRYGADMDREIMYESEEVTIVDDETGKVVNTTRVTGSPGSKYARWYAEWSSENWSPDPDINLLFLRSAQNYMNDKLRMRGHVFLNEVYEQLGLTHTEAGSIVGWFYNRPDAQDGFIDFGIWDNETEDVNDFFRGLNDAVLLDFNVDGPIYNRLDERDRGRGEVMGEER